MLHALDLDALGDFGDRARRLLSPLELRMYTAALIGRLSQRVPWGVHRGPIDLPLNTPTLLATNSTRDRALLVSTDFNSIIVGDVIYTSSSTAGLNDFARTAQAPGTPQLFILRPDEQLFATAIGVPNELVVSQETY